MSWLMSKFYDRIMAGSEEDCLQSWRKELLSELKGDVLEIGAGTGASLAFYDAKVTRLTMTEPVGAMRKQLEKKIIDYDGHSVAISSDSAQKLSYGDGTFDCVVSSLVCCSVPELHDTLHELKRVLKPGGKLVFLEHVGAEHGTRRRKWQNRITPIWRVLAGNCHMNRDTEQAIIDVGFRIESIQRESMRKAMPLVRPTIRGVAINPG